MYDELIAELEEKQPDLYEQLVETITFRDKMLKCSNFIKAQTQVKVSGKNTFLRNEIKGEGTREHNMINFDKPLTCPLDPTIKLYGAIPDECRVFKSAV
jgi:hypothetical protein